MEKHYCCVPKCLSTFKQNTNKLYLMPRLVHGRENTEQLHKKRRALWINNTHCIDKSPQDMYVCQIHFVKGKISF